MLQKLPVIFLVIKMEKHTQISKPVPKHLGQDIFVYPLYNAIAWEIMLHYTILLNWNQHYSLFQNNFQLKLLQKPVKWFKKQMNWLVTISSKFLPKIICKHTRFCECCLSLPYTCTSSLVCAWSYSTGASFLPI